MEQEGADVSPMLPDPDRLVRLDVLLHQLLPRPTWTHHCLTIRKDDEIVLIKRVELLLRLAQQVDGGAWLGVDDRGDRVGSDLVSASVSNPESGFKYPLLRLEKVGLERLVS